jgi:antitoxin component YwqK of YwqJK toxin-antitoxin module
MNSAILGVANQATHSSRLFEMIVPIYQMTKGMPLPFTYNAGTFTFANEETDDKGRVYYTLHTQDAQTGNKHGFHLSWWSADMSLSLAFYINGVCHGTNYEWNPAGQLIYQSDYQNGRKNGWTYNFHNNGHPARITYFADGKRQGAEVEYEENGLVKCINTYGPQEALVKIQTFAQGQLLYVDNYPA